MKSFRFTLTREPSELTRSVYAEEELGGGGFNSATLPSKMKCQTKTPITNLQISQLSFLQSILYYIRLQCNTCMKKNFKLSIKKIINNARQKCCSGEILMMKTSAHSQTVGPFCGKHLLLLSGWPILHPFSAVYSLEGKNKTLVPLFFRNCFLSHPCLFLLFVSPPWPFSEATQVNGCWKDNGMSSGSVRPLHLARLWRHSGKLKREGEKAFRGWK